MTFYLDSAERREIETAAQWSFIAGFTTNPLLMARTLKAEGKTPEAYPEKLRELGEVFASLLDSRPETPGRIESALDFMVQPLGETPEAIVEEASQLRRIFPRGLVLKIPFGAVGLAAAPLLKKENFRLAYTAVFSPLQALIAAQNQADFVIPFCHRSEQAGIDGVEMAARIAGLFQLRGIECPLLAASVKSQAEVLGLLEAGIGSLTLPYALYREILEHPLSRETLEQFSRALRA